ncbi:MAG: 2OG-Fe(II) oxygenase [Microthrixaceae bacterium]
MDHDDARVGEPAQEDSDAESSLQLLPMIAPRPRHQADRHAVPEAFDRAECERIVALAEPEEAEPASLEGDDAVDRVRSSSVSWLVSDDTTWWIYERLGELVAEANERWGFDLVGFEEELQYTRYDGPGDHYTWHRDGLDGDVSTRKISVVVQLTDPAEYTGAGLEFPDDDPATDDRYRAQGSAVLFPAFEYHRVTPLRSGRRRSLVAWVAGPPFR